MAVGWTERGGLLADAEEVDEDERCGLAPRAAAADDGLRCALEWEWDWE